MQLTLSEVSREMRNGKTLVSYALLTSGVPEGKTFTLWARQALVDESFQMATGLSLDQIETTTFVLLDFARGERFDFAVISTDETIRVFAEVIPALIEARGPGQCRLWVELISPNGDTFGIMGEGFEPSEVLSWESRSNGEFLPGTIQAGQGGRFATILLPAVVGKESGSVTYTVVGKSCNLTVSFQWGPPALETQ